MYIVFVKGNSPMTWSGVVDKLHDLGICERVCLRVNVCYFYALCLYIIKPGDRIHNRYARL